MQKVNTLFELSSIYELSSRNTYELQNITFYNIHEHFEKCSIINKGDYNDTFSSIKLIYSSFTTLFVVGSLASQFIVYE